MIIIIKNKNYGLVTTTIEEISLSELHATIEEVIAFLQEATERCDTSAYDGRGVRKIKKEKESNE